MPERRKSSRNAEQSSLLDSSCVFTSQKCQPSQGSGGSWSRNAGVSKVSSVTGIGWVLVAKRRTVVTFGLVLGLRVSKVSTVTGMGVGLGRETQNSRHFWTRFASSRLKSVNRHRDRGVVVAKRRTVVTFGLVLRLRVSKVSTVTGIGGSWSRNPKQSSLLDSSWVFASQQCQQSQESGGRGREAQTSRHFWTRFGSSRQKCQQSQGSGGLWSRNAEQSSLLDSSRVFASQKCHQSQGSGGSWSRNAEQSSLLDSSWVFASQKCQPSQGSGGSWSRNAEQSSLLDSSCVFASQECQQSQGSGGRGRETQNSRHFWIRL